MTKQEAEKVAAARSAAEMAARNASAPTERAAVPVPASVSEPERNETVSNITKATQEERKMADNTTAPVTNNQSAPVSDEVSVITEGTIIKGDIVSNGSLDVRGQVEGNVGCNGKLVVTGVVNGNSSASEFFADAAKIEGEVVSTGTIKIGLGSVIIGNVTSTSAVITAPLLICTERDLMLPITTADVSTTTGPCTSISPLMAPAIEGFCSQCYSDVDVQSLFNGNAQKGNE